MDIIVGFEVASVASETSVVAFRVSVFPSVVIFDFIGLSFEHHLEPTMTVEVSFLAIHIVVQDSTPAPAFVVDELLRSFLPFLLILDIGVDFGFFNEETTSPGFLLLAVSTTAFLVLIIVLQMK